MGQKINSNIFRLGISKNWKTEFFEKKSKELPSYIFADSEIKEYIERFLEKQSLFLHDFKIHHCSSSINLYVSYLVTPSFTFNKTDNATVISLTDRDLNREAIIKSNSKCQVFKGFTLLGSSLKTGIDNPTVFRKTKKYFKLRSSSRSYKTQALLSEKILCFENKVQLQQIRDFERWIKGLSLFTHDKTVYLTFRCLNAELRLPANQVQSLKKKFMLLQKFKNTSFFDESFDILFASVYWKNSVSLLVKLIALQLRKIKRHNFFLAFLRHALTLLINSNFSKFESVKIVVQGRLNGAARARKKIIIVGDLSDQTIVSNVDFAQTACHSANGSYGIKVWMKEKQQNLNVFTT